MNPELPLDWGIKNMRFGWVNFLLCSVWVAENWSGVYIVKAFDDCFSFENDVRGDV